MPLDATHLLTPADCALLVNEMQVRVAGADVESPLAASARAVLPNMAALINGARAQNIRVVHCVKIFRRDGLARNRNIVLYQRRGAVSGLPSREGPSREGADDRPVPGTEILPELAADPRDVVMSRLHGMGSVSDTGVDPLLRTLGVSTVVVIGVSVNVGVINVVMDLVNRGYDVVVPRDAVAGTPDWYAEAVIDHTIRNLAHVTTTVDVLRAWEQ
jgi:nicotinamidase-related amidase